MTRPNLLGLLLTLLVASPLASCKAVLTKWHHDSYVEIVPLDDPLVARADGSPTIETASDLARAAEQKYAQGYVLVGFSKFTHTLVPGFNELYAKMYAARIGASAVVVEEPRASDGVFAYTVTYWMRGKDFPLGAYYNDIPYETRLYFPDSLREYLGQGNQPVLVEAVVDGTTAQLAGLSAGELIIGLDGEPFAGAEDLDRRLFERGNRTARLDLWSPDGLHSVDVTIGQVSETPGALAPGAEALFYREPWASAEYQDFAWISHAFTEAWHASIASYEQAIADQEAAQREAARMQLLWDLEDEVAELEKAPRRGSTKLRFGGPIQPMDFSDVLPQAPSLGALYSNASAGWFYSHQGTMANLFGR